MQVAVFVNIVLQVIVSVKIEQVGVSVVVTGDSFCCNSAGVSVTWSHADESFCGMFAIFLL